MARPVNAATAPQPGIGTPSAVAITTADGHHFELLAHLPPQPQAALLWLPALGVAARHYQPFAAALAARGIAVFVHEWRGNGSSNLRAGKQQDWGYRELLQFDLPAAQAALQSALPGIIPRIGGHSLGGQLACCHAALHPQDFDALWLVASGTPWWRGFPAPLRWLLPLAYRLLPWLARRCGALPGRKLGFGGNEARGLIHDWAKVGVHGRYAAAGLDDDLEAALHTLRLPVTAVLLDADWLAPVGSMQHLLGKMPAASSHLQLLSGEKIGTRADHFSWMKSPSAVVDALCGKNVQKFSQKR